MKRWIFLFVLFFVTQASAQETSRVFLLDDFEGEITTGPEGTVDTGTENGSTVEVSADTQNKISGEQSLKIVYDAVTNGDIWVGRGYQLSAKSAGQWTRIPEEVGWEQYGAISFWILGEGKGTSIAFDIKDAKGRTFRFMLTDDHKIWKQVVCPFDQFEPDAGQGVSAPEENVPVFPLLSFRFKPMAIARGAIDVDAVSLEPLN